MWDRSRVFLRRAGTVILGINIILWFLATYPRSGNAATEKRSEGAIQTAHDSSTQALQTSTTPSAEELAGETLRHSFAGQMGRFIEPVIAPLGFDWKMGIGIVASFAAREVFVSTMSTVYNVGDFDSSESSMKSLAKTLQSQNVPMARRFTRR
jgi:ferrous iron transport protein B